MMSVSHDEIVKREKEWKRKRKRAKQRRAKASASARASSVKGLERARRFAELAG